MRFNTHAMRLRRNRLARWHDWFAWRPVKVDHGEFVWLERIQRSGGYDHRKNTDRRPRWRWQYRSA